MNRFSGFVFVIFCLVFSQSHASEKDNRMTLAFIDNLPPYSYEEDGVVKGIDIEIAKELFARMDIDISIELNPWARLILRAEEGTIDVIGATFCAGREPWRAFLTYSNPTFKSNISIFSRNTEEQKQLNSLSELAGSSVGKVRDYFYRDEFERADYFDIYEYKDDELLLRSLQMGRIGHAIAEELPFGYFCSQNESCDLIKKAFTFDDNPICLAFSNKHEEAEQSELLKMIERINIVIAEMQSEGFIDAVLGEFEF